MRRTTDQIGFAKLQVQEKALGLFAVFVVLKGNLRLSGEGRRSFVRRLLVLFACTFIPFYFSLSLSTGTLTTTVVGASPKTVSVSLKCKEAELDSIAAELLLRRRALIDSLLGARYFFIYSFI